MNTPLKVLPLALQQKHLASAKLYADRVNALELWPKNGAIAEIGVAYGGYSEKIITAASPAVFDAYDTFILHTLPSLWGRSPTEYFGEKTQLDFYKDKFAKYAPRTQVRTFAGDSSTNVAKAQKNFYDVIYIDGDHSENGVKKDVAASLDKLKPNGLLVFNDYVLYAKKGDIFGVVQAANDLCVNHGWKVVYLSLNREMYCDLALTR